VKRGQLYRVFRRPGTDPKKSRAFVVISRQVFIDSAYSTVICAPVYSQRLGLSSQVNIGLDEGMKADCCIHCDELISIEKTALTNFVGTLSATKVHELDRALAIAVGLA